MPQPPILPLIDWRGLFAAGLAWRPWLDIAERPEHRTELLGSLGGFHPLAESASRLVALRKPVHIVAIAESWCGDVRRHVPEAARRIIAQGKAANDIPGARKLVAAHYATDPHRRGAEAEIVEGIVIAATEAVAAAAAVRAAS